jgi:hypothetical protein
MKRQIAPVSVLVFACSMLAQAQAPQAPKPTAEHKKLAGFIGSWTVEAEAKPGNGYGAPTGKYTFVERYQWWPGEFFLQMNREGKGAGGDVKDSLIFGYDRTAKKYSLAFFDLSSGASRSGTGTNNGNTWTWAVNGRAADGKSFQERCTISLVPNVSYAVNCDTSPDGTNWSPAFEGKAAKSKS